jgi:N-acetylmuramoyl-L-alanine amidase
LAAAVVASLVMAARPATQVNASAYTLITADGRRQLPFRSAGSADLLPLDQLAQTFGFEVQEDAQAGGLIVLAAGQRVLLTPGQSLVSAGGRFVSLSGEVQLIGQTVFVPADFLSRALGPAISLPIDVRRDSRVIVVGNLRVPQITPQFERAGPNGRLVIGVQPPAPHSTTREGNRLVIRFQADALDVAALTGAPSEFVGPAQVDGAALSFPLGPAVADVRAEGINPEQVTVELLASAAPAASDPAVEIPAAAPPPAIDLAPSGVLRTIAIDPGHGGDDAGARGPGGTVEKELTLQVARRLKAAIESRVGLRVLLTRDGDEAVPIDRRTAFANNNKADLLVSLHANASLLESLRGAQVLSLNLEDYRDRARGLPVSLPVPVVGGGTRLIDAMPWDLAQIPHAPRSESLAGIFVRHLQEHQVPLYSRARAEAPLRVLVGANMPAVLVELGFLTNAEDERALASGAAMGRIIEALLGAIVEVRNGIPAPTIEAPAQ